MAATTTSSTSPTQNPDYFSRPAAARARSSAANAAISPSQQKSPRTPLLGRSISGQFSSPSSALSREQDETIVYELHPRFLSAGFAGEARPRCVLRFGYGVGDGRRVGDWRGIEMDGRLEGPSSDKDWGRDYEVFCSDARDLDLGLLEDQLGRAVRFAHTDYLQLDSRARRAVLACPSLLPTPVLETALRVLFLHYTQPGSVTLLPTPILACVGAGLRCGLVVDVGWEEIVVTGVGEYRSVSEKRSVRAGKKVVREMAAMLEQALQEQHPGLLDGKKLSFAFVEDVVQRLAWCSPSVAEPSPQSTTQMTIPLPPHPTKTLRIPFATLARPAEDTFFGQPSSKHDDHELPLPALVHQALLTLPLDLRALCTSRILLTGSNGHIPGLQTRLLGELENTLEKRGWDPVHSYGSAKSNPRLGKRSANLPSAPPKISSDDSPAQTQSALSAIPPHARLHDHLTDPLSQKVERDVRKREESVVKGKVRSVKTLGAWSGASLVSGLRVRGSVEVEREAFLKAGLGGGV